MTQVLHGVFHFSFAESIVACWMDMLGTPQAYVARLQLCCSTL